MEQTDASIALANAVVMVKALGVSLYPVMPAKMGELWAMLGMDASKIKWSSAYESIGIIKASNVHPLFRKLSNDDVKSLINRLGEMRGGQGRESA